jgi:FtsP/CotA-like multicopper oxidase with cupredoxin domain
MTDETAPNETLAGDPAAGLPDADLPRELSRRGFLRGAVLAGGGVVAATVAAACTPAATAQPWTYGPVGAPNPTTGPASSPGATPAATPGASHDHASPGASPAAGDHDAAAAAVVKRFLDGEAASLEDKGNQPYGEPKLDGDWKVFELSVDQIKHRIDAVKDPIDALGFNGTWPGPRLDVIEGDKVRAIFTNKLGETTGIHFHGQQLPNNMDGVPHITQDPIQPGASVNDGISGPQTGSHMFH